MQGFLRMDMQMREVVMANPVNSAMQRPTTNDPVEKVMMACVSNQLVPPGQFPPPLTNEQVEERRKVIKEGLDAGVNINERSSYSPYTFLTGACSSGYLPIIKILLEEGADVNLADPSGLTPLRSIRTRGGNAAIEQFLLDAGADPSTSTDGPVGCPVS